MKSAMDLKKSLEQIDRKSYGAYKSVAGQYDYGWYTLCIDHVQGDPFASPSKVRVVVRQDRAKFPPALFDTPEKKQAVEDHLIRLFYAGIRRTGERRSGSGNSGKLEICRCGQEVLARTAMQLDHDKLEARFEIGFPAHGRTIAARELIRILEETLPPVIQKSMLFDNLAQDKVRAAAELAEDQTYIRSELSSRGLTAFVANGAVLPRQSGVSDRPLEGGIPFQSPKELEVTLTPPNHGPISGMGIPQGITLIVGGGYHGKSTLLKALELGVYNHIAGDGREFVLTDDTAVKVRAEDGRSIIKSDISLFINHLPNGKNTRQFSTENASGSTSQAANIVESIEAGTKTLLIDEDTSATNLMIRDELMQRLITADQEPITPFIDRIRPLYEEMGISTVLVVGSSGSYFRLADHIIQMDAYKPVDITRRAKSLSEEYQHLGGETSKEIKISFDRIPQKGSLGHSDRGIKIKTRSTDTLTINKQDIDLRCLEQIVDSQQAAAIGHLIRFAEDRVIDGHKTLSQVADAVMAHIRQNGFLSVITGSYCPEFLSMPRKQELMAALNRLRGLRLK